MHRLTVSEHELQVGIVELLRRKYRRLLVYAVPNGGHRGLSEAVRLKAEGVTSGIPDLALVLPSGRAAFLEVKTQSGRLRPDQEAFGAWARANGVPWAVVRNIDETILALDSW